jgi:hypothetical protein
MHVLNHFIGHALDWIDFAVPNLTALLIEVIEIATAYPSNELISQIVIILNRAIEN